MGVTRALVTMKISHLPTRGFALEKELSSDLKKNVFLYIAVLILLLTGFCANSVFISKNNTLDAMLHLTFYVI